MLCPGLYWDFPGSAIAPMLSRTLDLPGATLESVARCEHKYWSRLEQQAVVPEMVCGFQPIDPFSGDPVADVEIDYPFWIKPIKAHSSFLGFFIDGPETLVGTLSTIREQIGAIARPFNEFLAHVEKPDYVAAVDGYHCIAEEIISDGFQCTLEGYAWRGEVQIYGVVDSVRGGKLHSSFTRYQYPSRLPTGVQERMIEASKRVIKHISYDWAAFNIEFYWNPKSDQITLLEINSRISKSHSPLFLMVDGATNQKVPLDLVLGRKPCFPHRLGGHKLAAKFMLRWFHDGILERVPTEDDLSMVNRIYPEVRMQVLAPQGKRLGELSLQDSYSYEVAEIFLGANSQGELLEKYRHICAILDFRVRALGTEVI